MTKEDLKIMQEWSFERKILVSQTRIMEWYMHYNGNVYISFSGGKDSTVLRDLVRRIYPDVPSVFADTGLEYPSIRSFVKSCDNVVWIRPEMNFKKVIETYGYPVISKDVSKIVYGARHGLSERTRQNYLNRFDGLNPDGTHSDYKQMYKKYKYLLDAPFEMSNRCCLIMKETPFRKYERETGRKGIVGTMATESKQRRDGWLKTGCNAFDANVPLSKPISFWTEQDVLRYLKQFNIPYAKDYGEIVEENGKLKTTGLDRTGCMFCAYGSHLDSEPNRFQKMKDSYPKQYSYCTGGGEYVWEGTAYTSSGEPREIQWINDDGSPMSKDEIEAFVEECKNKEGFRFVRKWKPNKNGLGLGEVMNYIGVKYE